VDFFGPPNSKVGESARRLPGYRADMADLDVIGVGFGRTGTASLRLALEQLGFGPCCHMLEIMDDAEKIAEWRRVGEGERPDWARLFAGYRASVDWPGAVYWRELADAYPDAKIILTVRDPQRWYASALATIFQFPMRRHDQRERMVYAMLGRVNPGAAALPQMLDKVVWEPVFADRDFDGSQEDREFAIKAFLQHTEEVIARVPRERLLVFDVTEGWGPLCAFLGKPEPSQPFPAANEGSHFNRVIAAKKRGAVVPVAIAGALIMGGVPALISWLAGGGAAIIAAVGLACALIFLAVFLGTDQLITVAGRRRAAAARG
jgi:Sulfotransferase domain